MPNEELELLDYIPTREVKRPDFLEFDEVEISDDSKKDYIIRNKKKYYKTERAYIYKCEDGYYAYRIYHKASKTNSFVNKHITTKERFNTEYKAYQAQQEHLINLEKSISFKYRKITFGDMWEDIKNNNAKEEATITKYESIYKHHVSHLFGNIPIQDISYVDINVYLEKMYKMGDGRGTKQNGYSYTFTESILKFFWLVFQHSFAKKVISADDLKTILENIQMPKQIDSKDIRILNRQEIQKVSELLKDTDYYLPFLVSLYTAARPAETFAIRFSDFDLENNTLNIERQIVEFQGTLTFKDPKTFARTVPIPQVLADEVKKRYAEIRNAQKENPQLFELNRKKVIYAQKGNNKGIDFIYDDMILLDTCGRYNAVSSFQYYAKIIRKEICINDDKREDFSFYCFRKTAISIMASHSVPIGSLMKITGHKKNETLFKYYYNDENEFAQIKVAEAVKSLETLIEK